MVKKLEGHGKLGWHEWEKNQEIAAVKRDYHTFSSKLGDLTRATNRLRKMKRKPRLRDYIDLETIYRELVRLNVLLFREFWLNILGNEEEEPFDLEKQIKEYMELEERF